MKTVKELIVTDNQVSIYYTNGDFTLCRTNKDRLAKLLEDNMSQIQSTDEEISEEDESLDETTEHNYDDSMDGDHQSALASCGWGTDEDYGSYGDGDY